MSDLLEYIERYFNGEFSPEEKTTFEGRCLSDPAFARMVAFYISLQEELQQQWIEQKKQEFSRLEATAFSSDGRFSLNGSPVPNARHSEEQKEAPLTESNKENEDIRLLREEASARDLQTETLKEDTTKVRQLRTWKRLAIAAAISGAIALSTFIYTQNNKSDPIIAVEPTKADSTKSNNTSNAISDQSDIILDSTNKQPAKPDKTQKKLLDGTERQQLFAQHFAPDTAPKRVQTLLEEAFGYYKKGSYKDASAAYEDALAVVENLETRTLEDEQEKEEKKRLLFYAHYYNALSYMANGKAAKAIAELKAIKESPDAYWQSKKQWYVALAYLKTGEVKNATTLLKQVAENKQARDYRQKAVRLSNELNSSFYELPMPQR